MVRCRSTCLRIDPLDEAIDCVVGRDTAFEVNIVREVDERSTSFLSALSASNNVGMFHRVLTSILVGIVNVITVTKLH